MIQALTYLLVGLAFGADLESGLPGVAVLFGLSVLVATGFGALGLALGLRTGNGEAVQGAFPLLFVLLFLSSVALPREPDRERLVSDDRDLEPGQLPDRGLRSLLISGWDGEALALAFGVALAMLAFGIWAATAALRTRMERT